MEIIGITTTYVPDISIIRSEKKIQQWFLLLILVSIKNGYVLIFCSVKKMEVIGITE
jgi:hypothetical protein